MKSMNAPGSIICQSSLQNLAIPAAQNTSSAGKTSSASRSLKRHNCRVSSTLTKRKFILGPTVMVTRIGGWMSVFLITQNERSLNELRL